jgi:regulator of protease activity HflC (stomatin/prohibitin superfamily)
MRYFIFYILSMRFQDEYGSPTTAGKLAVITVPIVVFSLIIVLLTSIKTVGATEVAVATRFGNVKGERYSGIHLELFSSYTKYDTRTQVHSTTQAAATNDLQDISVDITVNYRITADQVSKMYSEVGNQEAIKLKVLDPLVAQTLKSISTNYGGEELIQKRNEVSKEIQKSLTEKLSSQYHIEVQEVSLTNITFTNADFNAAIDKKQIAEQDTLKAQFELEKSKIDAQKQSALQQSLTAEILQKMWLEKWNGVLPTTMYVTEEQTSLIIPFAK